MIKQNKYLKYMYSLGMREVRREKKGRVKPEREEEDKKGVRKDGKGRMENGVKKNWDKKRKRE